MHRIDANLTAAMYADAVLNLSRERQEEVNASWLIAVDDLATRWGFRALVGFILIALAVLSVFVSGLFSVMTILAVVAVPVGMTLWLGIERWFRRVDRRLDDAILASGAADLARAIDAGRIAVPLGRVRIELDEQGVRVQRDGDAADASLTWPAVREAVHGADGVLLLTRRMRWSRDLAGAIFVPLGELDEVERAAVTSLVAEHTAGG